jgi:hypothetical protein
VPLADVLDSETDPEPVSEGAPDDDDDGPGEPPAGGPGGGEVVSDVDPETGPDDFDEAI